MAKLILPRVHVLVVCDRIRPDPAEDEVLRSFGARMQIVADSFPYTHRQLCIYLKMSGHEGSVSGSIIIVHADTDITVINYLLTPVQFQGPLVKVALQVRLRDVNLPAAGVYYIQLLFEGKTVAERSLELIQR